MLSEIAYDGMIRDQLFFAKRGLSSQIRAFLASNLNAPKHLDSEAVLNAVEVQQGLLVERAENTYSFSHLTLQEYLTAQYVVDNDGWQALVQNHLVDNRWREIFLLLPGLMTGRLGADNLLLAMEEKANCFLALPKLQRLVQWAELSTANSKNKSKASAKRSGAIFLAISISPSRSVSFDRAVSPSISRARARALDLAVSLALDLAVSLDLGRAVSLDLAKLFDRSEIFRNTDCRKLVSSLESLQKEKPSTDAGRTEREEFVRNVYGLLFSTFGIDAETITLSEEELEASANYFYACELMIRCKEGAVRVSPDVWEGIESRILTVPATEGEIS